MVWIILAISLAFALAAALLAVIAQRWHARAAARSIEAYTRNSNWAPELTPTEQDRFLRLIRHELLDRAWSFTIVDGHVLRDIDDDRTEKLALTRLANSCSKLPTHRWPDVITGYFDAIWHADEQDRHLEPILGCFDEVKHMLSLRLFSRGVANNGIAPEDNLVQRVDLPGTVTHLVFELPNTVRTVRPSEAALWGKPQAELFAIALDNLRKAGPPPCEQVDLHDGVECFAFSDESFFTASQVLLLDYLPDCVGTYGAIIAVPTRHTLICYPIEDLNVVNAINKLTQVARDMYDDGPGSITANLYWHNGGRFTALPCQSDEMDEATLISPPEQFLVVLNELASTEDNEPWFTL